MVLRSHDSDNPLQPSPVRMDSGDEEIQTIFPPVPRDNNGDGFDDADDDKNGIINDIGEAHGNWIG